MSIPIFKLNIPEYKVDSQPDFAKIGTQIDKTIIDEFLGQKLVIRCLGSQNHPGKTLDELVDIILKLGTDRYDPSRIGDRYENIDNKHIDIFALDFEITKDGRYLEHFIEPFYAWPKKLGETPIKLDIIILYNQDKLDKVEHKYKGRDDVKSDGFIFKEPGNKVGALKGIIKIL